MIPCDVAADPETGDHLPGRHAGADIDEIAVEAHQAKNSVRAALSPLP